MNMKTSMRGRWLRLLALYASLLLAGCSLAPAYERPDAKVPTTFKEEALTAAEASSWQAARPSEQLARGDWWVVFNDAMLDDLEKQAADSNQNLQAAAARLKQSRALQTTVRAGLFPSVDAGFGPTRERASPASQGLSDDAGVPARTLWRAQGTVSYEVDLFGRVSDSVAAASADVQQTEAIFRSVLLALQADVAENYFQLRELDAQGDVFSRTVGLREQTLGIVQHRFEAADVSELDMARARSDLASARSDAMTVQRRRASSEHSLAVLLGKSPAEFAMAASPLKQVDIRIPAGLPSSLLERRPDIAAAERAMAAANARIGVAKSAFFPSLNLTGAGGFESATLGDLFHWSSRTFLLGPLTGTELVLPLFDGGRRSGNLARAQAVYEEDVANYRQQVLAAFREVEDNLSDLRILRDQTGTQAEAVAQSNRATELSRTQYREGAVQFLDVIDAERTMLLSERAAVQLMGAQAVSTVRLIRALGGGWGTMPGALPANDNVVRGEVRSQASD
jgi:multidrug efflux system outer membrane protein